MEPSPQAGDSSRFYAPEYRRQLRDSGALASLSASGHIVLSAMCDRANAAGLCWPAVETIATEYGIGISSVRRALAELTEVGMLLVLREPGKPNRYRLTVPRETPPKSRGVLKSSSDPSQFEQTPLPNRAQTPPDLSTEHVSKHKREHDQEQQQENRVVVSPKFQRHDHQFPADLVEQLAAKGLRDPGKLAKHDEGTVRAALVALSQAKGVTKPAAWLVRCLDEGWTMPEQAAKVEADQKQAERQAQALAIAASAPPPGTRYVRFGDGRLCEVLEVREDAIKFAYREPYGSDWALMASSWPHVEWLDELPDGATVSPLPMPSGFQYEPEVQRRRDKARIERDSQREGWSAEKLERRKCEAGLPA
jgi:DNA-binding transcriptional ArsR family regulator